MPDGRATPYRVRLVFAILVLLLMFLAGPILMALAFAVWIGWIP